VKESEKMEWRGKNWLHSLWLFAPNTSPSFVFPILAYFPPFSSTKKNNILPFAYCSMCGNNWIIVKIFRSLVDEVLINILLVCWPIYEVLAIWRLTHNGNLSTNKFLFRLTHQIVWCILVRRIIYRRRSWNDQQISC